METEHLTIHLEAYPAPSDDDEPEAYSWAKILGDMFRVVNVRVIPADQVTHSQHLKAGQNRNGNPRRLYIGYQADGEVAVVEVEGYRGRPAWVREAIELSEVVTTVAEYRNWRKFGKDTGILRYGS